MDLDLRSLRDAVAGTAAAFRCITDYQPVGGCGDKVFPPTYEGGKYATENRVDPKTGEMRHCVLLDSVQSQANRMEFALLEAHRANRVALPILVTLFDQDELPRKFAVSSLEAPHRVADALFRDSLLSGVKFRESDTGRVLDKAEVRNAAGLFGLCPTALVFGLWDSTGPRGGLGAKFQRALVSEIVGYDAVAGVKTSSRIDPAAIQKGAGPVYRTEGGDWTLSRDDAKKGASGRPVLYRPNSKGQDVVYDPRVQEGYPGSRPPVRTQPWERHAGRFGRRIHDIAGATDHYPVAGRLAAAAIPARRRSEFEAGGRPCRAHRTCRVGARGGNPGPERRGPSFSLPPVRRKRVGVAASRPTRRSASGVCRRCGRLVRFVE